MRLIVRGSDNDAARKMPAASSTPAFCTVNMSIACTCPRVRTNCCMSVAGLGLAELSGQGIENLVVKARGGRRVSMDEAARFALMAGPHSENNAQEGYRYE